MSTVFLRSGNDFRPADEADLDLHPRLPGSNFIVQINPMTEQFFFAGVDPFTLPSKLYGKTERQASRILNTFADRTSSTGVLLAGEKGSGKSLLAKTLSVMGAKLGYPTIVINSPYRGDKFNKLIQDVEQPAIVMFDEFEKVYDRDQQTELLTLLDGTFPTKKLFVLTCNDEYRIDEHMRNRPGRIYYRLDFRGLEEEFIREYCNDQLNEKQHIDKIIQLSKMFDQFNFDMLKALIEEMNRYGESPRDALEMLNTKPGGDGRADYKVTLHVKGTDVTHRLHESTWSGSPLSARGIDLYFSSDEDIKSDDNDLILAITESGCAEFKPTDLSKIEPNGRLVYTNYDGDIATFERVSHVAYDYRNVF